MIAKEEQQKMKEDFLKELEKARREEKTIGLVQGSWDLFHIGHLRYILEARKLCDYLIVAMDSDEKIRKRKGETRPIIPEEERYEFIKLLNIANSVVVKEVDEPKWGLIRLVRPDVLVAIKDNYSDEDIKKLEEICGRVAILPRQSETSTSDKIRKIMISGKGKKFKEVSEKVKQAVIEMCKRIGHQEEMPEPIPMLIHHLEDSTDWVCPVAAGCFWNGTWFFGTNQTDFSLSKYDIENRTELYYATTEHAEMNLLKKLGEVKTLDTPIWTTLFPCDECMKVLIDKGVKQVYYLEDHPERNWSKRSHALAEKHGVQTIPILEEKKKIESTSPILGDMNAYQYIYPPNAREQKQLDIMLDMEAQGKDPLDPKYIDQEIMRVTDYWYISKNRFPYEGVEEQFLIVARYPVYQKEQITDAMWNDLQNIWLDLSLQYDISGGALCLRFGDPSLSGATLKRFHVHLIKPKEESKAKFSVGGHKQLKKGLYMNHPNPNEKV